MNKLKPCPFCGSPATMLEEFDVDKWFYIQCSNGLCSSRSDGWRTKELAIEAWNKRVEPTENNDYDKSETFDNCTVHVLSNTKTGDVSIGWFRNDKPPVIIGDEK